MALLLHSLVPFPAPPFPTKPSSPSPPSCYKTLIHFQKQHPPPSRLPCGSRTSDDTLLLQLHGGERSRRNRSQVCSTSSGNSAKTAGNRVPSRWKPKELVLGNPTVKLEKGVYSYDVSTLIDKLSSLPPRGSIARCLESFKNRLSLNDFALVFKEFSRRGDWQRSLRLFKYMQRQTWCRPNEQIHAILLGLLGRESLLDKCADIFDNDMPAHNVPRTALSYTALINAFGRNGRHDVAVDLLHQMKSRDSISPTVLTYNTVINACARASPDSVPFDTLLGLFAQMRHDGIRPDLVTYNTLLAAAESRALPDQAEMVFRAMNEAGILPDVTTHTYLVETFAKVGRLSRVSDLLREMEAAGNIPDPASYNVLIDAYARSGSTEEAIGILRQMQAAGCRPNAATYSFLLNLYGRNGRYEDVRELFLEMKVGDTEPDAATYNILIQVFGEGGYFKEVVTLFHDMLEENVGPNMETYEGLLFACGKGCLHGDANAILSHMDSHGVVPSSKAYNGVIEAYGQAALYEEAIVAFNTMHEIGSLPTVETYNSVMRTFAGGGLFKEARAILSRMNGSGIQMNEDSYNGLIEAFCQGGQFEDALKAYVEMQKSRCNPDQRTLEAVLNVYSTAGLVDESRDQFLEIQSLGIMPSVMAYCMLLSVYAKNDRWHNAYQLLEEMELNRVSNTHQVIASMILGHYDDESNWQMVEYVFDKFRSEGCGFGLRFYNALLEALWWMGQKARAVHVLSEAVKRGLFPELYRQSKLVWSVDVHRMSVGGALTAMSTWFNDILGNYERGDDLPQLAAVVVVRGDMEKSSATRGFPVARAAYSFLKDSISPSFSFPGWNKGRIICNRSQLKRLLSEKYPDGSVKDKFVPITNMAFPLPGTRIYTTEEPHSDGGELVETRETRKISSGEELMATAAM